MAVTYKLWLEIERHDDKTDEYESDPDPREVAIRLRRGPAETLRRLILAEFGEFEPLEGD